MIAWTEYRCEAAWRQQGGVRVTLMFVETYRATVAAADCDHLGHMNVQHYFAAVSEGMFAIMVRLGLDPEEIRRRNDQILAGDF